MSFKPFLHQQLISAARTGNVYEVSELLKNKDIATHAGARFNAPLRAALYHNHQAIADKLLTLPSVKRQLLKNQGTYLFRLKKHLGYRALILALEKNRRDLADELFTLPLIQEQLLENKGEKLLLYADLLGFNAFKLLMSTEQTDIPFETIIKKLLNIPAAKNKIIENLKEIYRLAGTKIPKWKLMSILLNELPKDTFLPLLYDPVLIQDVRSYAQIFLFDVFSPTRRFEKAPTTPLEMAYYARITSHLLGLNNKVEVPFANKTIHFDVAGLPLEPSLSQLASLLQKYLNHLGTSHPDYPSFNQIEEAMRLSARAMPKGGSAYETSYFETLAKRYQSDKLIFLSSGWSKEPLGHGIGLAFLGDYLVYCNRGESGPQFGTHIFKIEDRSKINAGYLKRLDYLANKSFADIKSTLSEIIDFDNPVVIFTSKSQEHLTCGLCNPKSSIEGMHFLCLHSKENSENLKNLAKKHDRDSYKNFTKFLRDDSLKEVIRYANSAETKESRAFMASLLKNILMEHHGVSRTKRKSDEEFIRAQDILDNVRKEIQDVLLQDQDLIPILTQIRSHTLTKMHPAPPKITQTSATFWAEKTKTLKGK